jgi:hypothetical protein
MAPTGHKRRTASMWSRVEQCQRTRPAPYAGSANGSRTGGSPFWSLSRHPGPQGQHRACTNVNTEERVLTPAPPRCRAHATAVTGQGPELRGIRVRKRHQRPPPPLTQPPLACGVQTISTCSRRRPAGAARRSARCSRKRPRGACGLPAGPRAARGCVSPPVQSPTAPGSAARIFRGGDAQRLKE